MAKKRTKTRPSEKIQTTVCNHSSRNGVKPNLIILHSTESHNRPGISDVSSIVNWFNTPSAQASSNVVVDAEAVSAMCVPDELKAWAQAYWNPHCLSIEMIGFAAQNRASWVVNNRAQIKKVAKYIAYWSIKYNIPIQRGKVNEAAGTVTKSGVTTHNMLGQRGGGHHDPGKNFPFTVTLTLAKFYKQFGWY